MIKQELLKVMDDELPEKLFGFCYARTNDGCGAQDLCAGIIFALIKAANTDREIAGELNVPTVYVEIVAEKIARMIRKTIPEYLLAEWRFLIGWRICLCLTMLSKRRSNGIF